jgi:hypothetical protein
MSMAVLLKMPLAEARASFGPWGTQTSAVDATTTRWSVEGESVEHLFGALAWIPAGVDYELAADPELIDFVRSAATRAANAVSSR